MLQIIYVSSAKTLFSSAELVELLRKAREKNTRLGITGMLLYKDGNFIQVLEGPDDKVSELFATISQDPRHRAIIAMSRRSIEKTEFGDWSMGFTDMAGLTETDMPGLNSYLDESFSPETLSQNPTRARLLLETFRKNMR